MKVRPLILGAIAATGAIAIHSAAALAQGAGIGYQVSDTSYCSTELYTEDYNGRVNVREGPGLGYEARHYGVDGDYVDILRASRGGDPNEWAAAEDRSGYIWYQVGFPASRAYGWVREDFLVLPPTECRN
jgi:hypothetical protein